MRETLPTLYFSNTLFCLQSIDMGTWPQYRLHNHKLYQPKGIIHLKYLETTIGYTIIHLSLKIKK